jgi:hypothetical protein
LPLRAAYILKEGLLAGDSLKIMTALRLFFFLLKASLFELRALVELMVSAYR